MICRKITRIGNLKNIFSFGLILFIFFNSFAAFAQNRFLEPSGKARRWADKTLSKMTVQEKVGQIISIGINAQFWNEDNPAFQNLKKHVIENKIGGICLFGSPVYESVRVINRLQSAATIPLLISADFEAGIGMRFEDTVNFPWNMAVAATNEPDFARRQGSLTAKEARALGIQQILAPVVDVNNNAANPVINVRSYGENPSDVSRFASAFVVGAQSQNALATLKHFPGHGDTAVDSHRGLPVIDLPRSRFDAVEFAPFKAAIDAGAASVMISHIAVPQLDGEIVKPLANSIKPVYADTVVYTDNTTIPATLSAKIQTGILRGDLGFRGLIVTDAMDMSGLTLYFNQDEAAVRAVLAGVDVLLKPASPEAAINGLLNAVKSGRIPESRLNEAVRRQLEIKYELGLTKNKIASFDEIEQIVASKEERDLADEIAVKALTLVRNNNQIPLAADKKIFIFGITNGDDRAFVANAFLRGLRQNGVRFEAAILDERSTEKEINAALDAARNAEIVLTPLYGRVRSGAKSSAALPENAANALRKLIAENCEIVAVSFGNPYSLLLFPEVKTYLVAYGDMPSLQRAAAQALTGRQNITGRLPITLPGLHERGAGIQIQIKRN
jgi:beta-N-acetylhexosaminidase